MAEERQKSDPVWSNNFSPRSADRFQPFCHVKSHENGQVWLNFSLHTEKKKNSQEAANAEGADRKRRSFMSAEALQNPELCWDREQGSAWRRGRAAHMKDGQEEDDSLIYSKCEEWVNQTLMTFGSTAPPHALPSGPGLGPSMWAPSSMCECWVSVYCCFLLYTLFSTVFILLFYRSTHVPKPSSQSHIIRELNFWFCF